MKTNLKGENMKFLRNNKVFFMGALTIATMALVGMGLLEKSTYQSNESIQPNLLSQLSLDSVQEISKETYKTFLKGEETRIWGLLKEVLNMSQDECNAKKIQWQSYYANDAKELQDLNRNLPPLSSDTLKVVKGVLQDFNIAEDAIVILPFEDFCPAAADDCSLFINETLFNQLSPDAQKFCIAHELQHFLNKDDSTNYVLLQHCDQDKSELSAEHPIQQISRLQELRADLGAAAKNDEYAQGFKEFINIALEIVGDGPGTTHPKNTLRLSYAEKLIAKTIVT